MKKKSYQGISTLEVLDGAKNYNRWIAESLRKFATSPIIEIGAGTGNITEHFVKLEELLVTDIDEKLLTSLKNKFFSLKNVRITKCDISKKPRRSLRDRFQSCVAVNVLEHLPNDERALMHMNKLLKKGGVLLLVVPAKRFAFTKLDENLGHFRRYEKEELFKKVKHSGFDIEKLYFFNIVGLFSWILRDKIEKNHYMLSKRQIGFFDMFVPMLKKMESHISIPVGISLVCIARKA